MFKVEQITESNIISELVFLNKYEYTNIEATDFVAIKKIVEYILSNIGDFEILNRGLKDLLHFGFYYVIEDSYDIYKNINNEVIGSFMDDNNSYYLVFDISNL